MADADQIKTYKAALKKAWEDGVITPHEHQILSNLRKTLDISEALHQQLEAEVQGALRERPCLIVYKAALEQAWLDKIITKDEKAILDRLRSVLHITDDEQQKIDSEIRQKIFVNTAISQKAPTETSAASSTGYSIAQSPVPKQTAQRIRIKTPVPNNRLQQQTPTTPDEGDASFWLNQGEKLFNNSNGNLAVIEEAITLFNKAIEIEPLNYLAWSNKGLGLKILNRYDDALLCYERALSLRPEHVNSWFNKAVLLGCMNRYKEAAECYKKVLELEPEHELARRDLQILNQFLNSQK